MEDLVEGVGLTRGALYHHFESKAALFRAVVEDVEQEFAEHVAAAAVGAPNFQAQVRQALDAFLDECIRPDVARIVFIDGPAVLGWDTWQEIDEQYGFKLVVAGLEAAMESEIIEAQPVEALALLVFGAITRAGMSIARSPDPKKARDDMAGVVQRLISSLGA